MLLHCHSRKCNTTRDHKLKLDTSEVICMDCGESNDMVSEFMKNAMKASGDVYRTVKGKKAFMYKCPKCGVDRGVRVIDEQAACEVCQFPLNLSGPMIEAIKSGSGSIKAEVEDEAAPKEEVSKGVIKRRKG